MGLRLVCDIVGQYGGAFTMTPRDDGTLAEVVIGDERLQAA